MIRLIATLLLCLCATAARGEARRIADLNPGPAGSYPSNFTTFANALYFTAYTQATGFELWKYNGASVQLVADINDTSDDIGFGVQEGNDSIVSWLTEFNGSLYFSAFEPRRGGELWRYDGNAVSRVADISPDANDNIKLLQNSSWPNQLTVFNNALYFSANSGTISTNYELWKYDGVAVTQAANIHPDIGQDHSSYPIGLTVFNGALYFMANDGSNGYELWKHDGARATMVSNINPGGPESSSYPKHFAAFNNVLYFQAFSDEHGYELWKMDGSAVSLAADINPGPASSAPEFLAAHNGALYFRANDGVHGYELWKFDGATASIVADVNPAGDSYPKNLIPVGDALYFAADDGVHGFELWKLASGAATMVRDLNPAGDSFPETLRAANGVLYFVAATPETGFETWKLGNGEISLAADVNPGPGDSFPQFYFAFNDELVFRATSDGVSDWEPWALPLDHPGPVTPPEIISIEFTADSVRLRWKTTAGKTDVVQSTTDLAATFIDESSPLLIPGTGEVIQELTLPIAGGQQRFYRIRSN